METLTQRTKARRDGGVVCAVHGCYHRTHGVSRHCAKHDGANQKNGDPLARAILLREVEPYRPLARQFITQHSDHPGIKAGVEWLRSLLTNAAHPGTKTQCRLSTEKRVAWWLCRLRDAEITAEAMLEMVVSVTLCRLREPRKFRSDRHYCFTVVGRLCRMAPATHYSPNGTARTEPVTVGVVDHLTDRFKASRLLFLALRIAEQISTEMDRPSPDLIPGVEHPFT